MQIERNFGPVYADNSRILILGSFPSRKSREEGFYYAHPQNRFWRLLARIYGYDTPNTLDDKRSLLLSNRIALWDVLESCEIIGSDDSSIKNPEPVDIMSVLNSSEIEHIYCNGATAFKLYQKHLLPVCRIEATKLPSTSPANAAWSLEKLYTQWEQIRPKNLEK